MKYDQAPPPFFVFVRGRYWLQRESGTVIGDIQSDERTWTRNERDPDTNRTTDSSAVRMPHRIAERFGKGQPDA